MKTDRANTLQQTVLKQVLPKVIWEQPCHKVPIRYFGWPQFTPKTAPSALMIMTPSNTPIPQQTPPTILMASGFSQPFCHNTLCKQTDRQTNRQTDRETRDPPNRHVPTHKPLMLA